MPAYTSSNEPRRVVEVVEGDGVGHRGRGRVAGGAEVAVRDGFDALDGPGREEVGPGRTEPDHRDQGRSASGQSSKADPPGAGRGPSGASTTPLAVSQRAVARAHLDVGAREALLRPGGVLVGQLRLELNWRATSATSCSA